MTKRNATPTIIAETSMFGVRVSHDSNRDTTVSNIDCMDPPCATAVTQAGKLAALTCLMNGDGFDVFDNLAASHKQNIIWLIDDLAHQVLAIAQLACDMYCMPKAEVNHD